MKSVFYKLALFFIVLFLSCEGDNSAFQQNGNNETNVNNVANKISPHIINSYMSYINSKKYQNYLEKLSIFNSKIPKYGDFLFKNETEFFYWLSLNLDITGFTSLDSARSEFDAIVLVQKDLINTNILLFEELNNLNDEEFEDVMDLGINSFTPTILNGPCENACINTAVSCSRAVNHAYTTSMSYATNQALQGNFFVAAALMTIASINQHAGQHTCATNFNSCMEGCN